MSNISRPSTPENQIIQMQDDSPLNSDVSDPRTVRQTHLPNPFGYGSPLPRRLARQTTPVQQPAGNNKNESEVDRPIESDTSDANRQDPPQQAEPATPDSAGHSASAQAPTSASQPLLATEAPNIRKEQEHANGMRDPRASSAPPDLGPIQSQAGPRHSNYIVRFHQQLLPPPNLPIWKEMLAYTQRWGFWATMVKDEERRKHLVDNVCDKIRDAWNEGIKKEVIASKAPPGYESMSEANLQRGMEEQRARERDRKKAKRQPSPSRAVVIDTRRNIYSDLPARKVDYSITAGELAEAHVKWQNVKQRIQDGNLDPGSLVERVTTRLGSTSIVPSKHWLNKARPSRYNIHKRDLLVYCIWETFRAITQLNHLHEVLDMLGDDVPRQQETQQALEAEQKLHDQVMAVALELDPDGEDVQSISSSVEDSGHDPIKLQGPQAAVHELSDSETSSSDPSQKKKKLDTPDGTGVVVEEATPVAPMTFSEPTILRRQIAFVRTTIRPQANSLLQEAGTSDDLLDETVDSWSTILKRLQQASVNNNKIDDLVQEINTRFAKIAFQDLRQKLLNSLPHDVTGYPTRFEIWSSIPPEGLTNEELTATFSDVRQSDSAWQNLVKSVATPQSGRWLPNKVFDESASLPESTTIANTEELAQPLSLRIVFKINPARAYDPVSYGLTTVNNTQGFKWRYLSTSTIQQRMSMDAAVENYVEWRKDKDRAKGGARRSGLRYGTYDRIASLENPRGEAIVHGAWDMHRKNDKKSDFLLHFERAGEEHSVDEIVDLGFKSFEPVMQGSMEDVIAYVEHHKKVAAAKIDGQVVEEEDAQSTQTPTLSQTITSRGTGSSKKRGRSGRRGGSTGASRGMRGMDQPVGTPSKKGRKRKSVMGDVSENESPRVKRRAATRVNYAEGNGEGEDDEEGYMPVDSE